MTFGGTRIEQTQCVQETAAWGYDAVSDEKEFIENYEKTARLVL